MKDKIIKLLESGTHLENVCINVEELGELIQTISKMERVANCNNLQEIDFVKELLLEEMADVSIVLERLKIMYGFSDEDLERKIEDKMERNMQRLEFKNFLVRRFEKCE